MTQDNQILACRLLEKAGYEVRKRNDYSGRGMYGETTFGIVIDDCYEDPAELIERLVNEEIEEETRYLGAPDFTNDRITELVCLKGSRMRSDNMGLSMIVY